MMSIEELKQEATRLPETERGQLIVDLLATLHHADYDISDEEVATRVKETESGEVEDISFEELKAGLQLPSPK
ncbi:MAG: hypothetical protein KGS60_08230 [Verrucomicrobia bacterium]|nr:hypothetical protein [Verrucomicrobiota bacterium]